MKSLLESKPLESKLVVGRLGVTDHIAVGRRVREVVLPRNGVVLAITITTTTTTTTTTTATTATTTTTTTTTTTNNNNNNDKFNNNNKSK